MESAYALRRLNLLTSLQKEKIHFCIISNPANVFYYTGFNTNPHERFLGLIIDVEMNKEYLFVPALDEEAARQASDIKTVVPILDEQNPIEVIQKTIPSLTGTIGIEGKLFSYNQFIEFNAYFSKLRYKDIQPTINNQRLIKSPDEIIALKESIRMIEKVLEEGMKKVEIGMTEIELTAELEYLMRKFGSDGPAFETIVLSGENAALPHGTPGKRTIQESDLLLIDFGLIKDGYCSDITRTFAIKSVTEKAKKLYDIVLRSNKAGIESVTANVPLKRFDNAARKVIENEGYGSYFNNRIGHGLGIEVHEEPSVHNNNEILATKGMVFTIEPGIYIPGEIGIRIEDIVYINNEGKCGILTTFPKELTIL